MTEQCPYDSAELRDDLTVYIAHAGYSTPPGEGREPSRPEYEVDFDADEGSASFPFWGNQVREPTAAEAARDIISDAMRVSIAADEARVDVPSPDDVCLPNLRHGGEYAEMLDRMVEPMGACSPSEAVRLFHDMVQTAHKLRSIGIDIEPGHGDLNDLDERALAAKRRQEA